MPGSPPESLQFHVSIPLNRFEALISDLVAAARAPRDDPRISQILCQLQGLTIMVQTVQETIDANNAATATVIAGIQTDISTIAAELASLIPAPGSVVSQASADAMTANVAKLTAAKEALDGLITPPPPAPPATEPPPPAAVAFDATDTTPNAPGGRNTSHLPDFDPAVAETA